MPPTQSVPEIPEIPQIKSENSENLEISEFKAADVSFVQIIRYVKNEKCPQSPVRSSRRRSAGPPFLIVPKYFEFLKKCFFNPKITTKIF